MDIKEVWDRIFPPRIGDTVKLVRLTGKRSPDLEAHIGDLGIIVEYVEESWKKHMIKYNVYPRAILEEKLYTLAFPDDDKSWYAIRGMEIERV